ncbi:uncharacterized protein PHALS_12227 [Plasmopara halstedii]|uniref:Uncharacterized protein n=1 Tax=Plasmopara halstedii TaxID=4781 RepID=A0A0N7L5M8_PLAHL|nr:uncharacterized protein PHALS_12227 [Plasmopara halstedii]CEG41915.1 hypothetical protein PHALS_12227 [Plasmopara halstedii]|eukprot:XP_024578284.1 hypothetical protein PHALS_12227 [Plasmopara halstedii]
MSSKDGARTSAETLASNSTDIVSDLLLLEKERTAKEEAIQTMSKALLEETLTRLRSKAQQLQDNKWMFT